MSGAGACPGAPAAAAWLDATRSRYDAGMAEASPIALDDLQPGDELLQSALWGRFKERFGWRAQPLQWEAAGDGGTLLALTRSTPLGPLVYVPGGPPRPPTAPAQVRGH